MVVNLENDIKTGLTEYYKEKIVKLRNKYEDINNKLEVQYGTKFIELKLKYEEESLKKDSYYKHEIENIENRAANVQKTLEEKIEKLRKDFKEMIQTKSEKIEDCEYNIQFLSKQHFNLQVVLEETEKDHKTKVVELESGITQLSDQIKTIEIEKQQIIEETTKILTTKTQEIDKIFEEEKKVIIEKKQEACEELKTFYIEKIKYIKEKYKKRLEEQNSANMKTIENLNNKLAGKTKLLKHHKSEINGLKAQLKYIDTTVKIFSPHREPFSPSKSPLDITRKSTFFRPVSVNKNRLKNTLTKKL